LDGDLQGTHLKAWSVGEMIRTDVMRRGIPWVALLARERALPAELNLGWRHRAGAALSLGAVVALLARRPGAAVAALGGLVALNGCCYRLRARQRGVPQAVAGVGLHVVHHLSSAAAVPLGAAAHLAAEDDKR